MATKAIKPAPKSLDGGASLRPKNSCHSMSDTVRVAKAIANPLQYDVGQDGNVSGSRARFLEVLSLSRWL
jgi:hypothetical protein